MSFGDDAQILQCEEACGDVVCNVHRAGCPQDDQNGQTPVLFQGWVEAETQISHVLKKTATLTLKFPSLCTSASPPLTSLSPTF